MRLTNKKLLSHFSMHMLCTSCTRFSWIRDTISYWIGHDSWPILFSSHTYFPFFPFKFRFTVPEEEEPGYFVGKVEANDPDEGKNGRVFYYIIDGNVEKWFSVDKTYGNIYTKKRLDREERDHYMIQVKTTNNPDLVRTHHMFSRILIFFLTFFVREKNCLSDEK